jgi:DNA-binding NtrC family response regulator
MKFEHILIVDDDVNASTVVRRILEKKGYKASCAHSAEEALALLEEREFDLLLIDLVLPGMDGLTLLKKVKKMNSALITIIITAYGTINTAVEALKIGASDFMEKPLVPEKLFHVLQKNFEAQRLRKEVAALRSDLADRYRFASIIGKHPKMQRIFKLIESVSDTDSSVLITGETGTGKELVARAVHFQGNRAHRPFVVINCAALPENLLESELFGYEQGAFTGANSSKLGKLEQAEGGTVFLDEIGDMPMGLQAKLLRAIQEKKIEPLGSTRTASLSIRFISATNKELSKEIALNRFRMDLFYRLNVIPINIPPLRERNDDIPLLVDHFLDKLSKSMGTTRPHVSPAVMSRLMVHSWPGNVRELENVTERAIIENQGEIIEAVRFSDVAMPPGADPAPRPLIKDPELSLKAVRDQIVSELEREYFKITLDRYQGSIKQTARHARVDTRTVRRKMRRFRLDKWDYK